VFFKPAWVTGIASQPGLGHNSVARENEEPAQAPAGNPKRVSARE
jgi:hypothetical protein